MSTLEIMLCIALPIAYLIGRYYKAVKQTNYDNLSKARDYWREQHRTLSKKRFELHEEVAAQSKEVGRLLQYTHKLSKELHEAKSATLDAPKFQVVANKDKHPAANDNYLYVDGKINGNREAGLLKLSDWTEAKERLLKNPEDKPL